MHLPIEQLYKDYKDRGDKIVIDALSSRLDLWYRALSICKLGGAAYNTPYETACTELSNSINSYKRLKSRQFVGVAHKILQTQIDKTPQPEHVEYTNTMLKNKQPFELLESVWPNLNDGDQKLLLATYTNLESLDNLKKQGHFPDGIAFAVLKARNAIKRLLQQREQITFTFTDELSNRDLAPLPLYEAKALRGDAEERAFEYWLADAPHICDDLIEFAPFAHSMRHGSLEKLNKLQKTKVKPTPAVTQPEGESEGLTRDFSPPDEDNNIIKLIIIGVALAVVAFAIFILLNSSSTP